MQFLLIMSSVVHISCWYKYCRRVASRLRSTWSSSQFNSFVSDADITRLLFLKIISSMWLIRLPISGWASFHPCICKSENGNKKDWCRNDGCPSPPFHSSSKSEVNHGQNLVSQDLDIHSEQPFCFQARPTSLSTILRPVKRRCNCSCDLSKNIVWGLFRDHRSNICGIFDLLGRTLEDPCEELARMGCCKFCYANSFKAQGLPCFIGFRWGSRWGDSCTGFDHPVTRFKGDMECSICFGLPRRPSWSWGFGPWATDLGCHYKLRVVHVLLSLLHGSI